MLPVFDVIYASSSSAESQTEELISLIDEGQRHNRSLIISGQGYCSLKTLNTVEGLKFRSSERAARQPEKKTFITETFTEPQTLTESSVIAFDGPKVRWSQGIWQYAFDGQSVFRYANDNGIDRAIVSDEKYVALSKYVDPRFVTATYSDVTFSQWIRNLKKLPDPFTLRIIPRQQSDSTYYDVSLDFKSGYVQRVEVDEERGYEIVKATASKPDGRLVQEIIVNLMQSPSGGWMTKNRIVRNYWADNNDDKSSVLITEEEYSLDSFKFGPVNPIAFTFDGLGVPAGTRVIDSRSDPWLTWNYTPSALWNIELPTLVANSIPETETLHFTFDPNRINNQSVLFCFSDMNQRPSRHYVEELVKKAEELKKKGIVVALVQTAQMDQKDLDEWVAKDKIPFPVGMIKRDVEKVLLNWGVRGLPWLILTDQKHIVRAEGFSIDELNDKLKIIVQE